MLRQVRDGFLARDWNTKSGTRGGFVTRFSVADSYASRFERRVVGAREHEELWVPTGELPDFNIEGKIEVIGAHFGDGYRGDVPEGFGLRGKDAHEQFVALARTLPYAGFDVVCEMAANHTTVFLNFFFWEQEDFSAEGIDAASRDDLLVKLRKGWAGGSHGTVPLGLGTRRQPSPF